MTSLRLPALAFLAAFTIAVLTPFLKHHSAQHVGQLAAYFACYLLGKILERIRQRDRSAAK